MSLRSSTWLATALAVLMTACEARDSPTPPPTVTVYEAAIARGLSYLDTSRPRVSRLQWLLVDYLQRKFGLDARFAAVNTLREPPHDEVEALHFHVHQRIAFPDELVDHLPLAEVDPMSRVVMAAAHCDHIPVFPGFTAALEQMIGRGDYDLTHAALSLQLASENGCAILPDARLADLRTDVARRMAALAADPKTVADLRCEAIALLLYTGHPEAVHGEWLDRIAAEQQPDGGWRNDPAARASNDHTTVLAIWALLEVARPQAPRLPLLRRPSGAHF